MLASSSLWYGSEQSQRACRGGERAARDEVQRLEIKGRN